MARLDAVFIRPLKFPSRVDAGDTTAEIVESYAAKACGFDAFGKVFLGGEFADTFCEILIGLSVIGDNLSEFGQNAKGIGIV